MNLKNQSFETFFKLFSYLLVFCGFFSSWISRAFGAIDVSLFLFALVLSWFLEDSKRQLSDRNSKILIFVVTPLFYIAWKYQIFSFGDNELVLAGLIGRIVLILAVIKLLQKKSNKDWIFLYLISFFLVLLAAGLSISPLYLASFILYLLTGICTVVAFEIRKTSLIIQKEINTEQIPLLLNTKKNVFGKSSVLLIPKITIWLLLSMVLVATPMFFLLPRVGGAGLGNNSAGLSSITGFSDSVRLGVIGQLKQNDAVVMRVKLDEANKKNFGNLHWRGIALDSFDNKTWSKSVNVSVEPFTKGERDFFQVNYPADKNDLTVQTFYLEPIESPVIFALASPIAIQGNFQTLLKDSEGALDLPRTGYERSTYKVYSDRTLPEENELRQDDADYAPKDRRYLKLPENTDERIAELAVKLTEKVFNRYDKAKNVESYLQNNFGYTLELKSGGEQPLADFLFNVREGHCEYFATAMAVMLRTQGIATRMVNGFQEGEYNETANVYVVRQKNAHSWVEVYFPQENVWIPFDPTPVAGQNDGTTSLGTLDKFNNYIVALETFWIQYFVSYDNQEQRSLFRSVKNNFGEYRERTTDWLNNFQQKFSDWWKQARGDEGFKTGAKAIGFGIAYLLAAVLGGFLAIWLYRKIKNLEIWRKLYAWTKHKNETTIVEFYERMQKVLASKGFSREPHQTPLEFAFALDMPEAVSITEKYNRVRFGEKNLSENESKEIESWLVRLENKPTEK